LKKGGPTFFKFTQIQSISILSSSYGVAVKTDSVLEDRSSLTALVDICLVNISPRSLSTDFVFHKSLRIEASDNER